MADQAVDGAQRRKRRSTSEVRARILDAAVAEFGSAGFAGATTAAIARRADVTEAQIFRLFANKAALFRTAVFEPLNAHFDSFQARYPADGKGISETRDLARRYIAELQDFMELHSGMLMSLMVANAYDRGSTDDVGAMAGLNAYFERGAALMSARVGEEVAVRPDLMVRVSFAAVLANVIFRDWLFPDADNDAGAIRQAIAEFVIDGIRANRDAGLDNNPR